MRFNSEVKNVGNDFFRLKNISLAIALSSLLTACGGGGSSLDTTAPTPPSNTSLLSSNGYVTVSGEAEAGSTVEVTFPDGTKATIKADSNGQYSLTSPTIQKSGSISITSTDAGGNTSGTTSKPYTDTTAPAAPDNSSVSTNGSGFITVSGVAEEGSTVTATFPDGSTMTITVESNGAYSLTSESSQTAGEVTITSTDGDGNTSNETTVDSSLFPSAPTINISANDDGLLTVSGAADAGSIVTITFPDGTQKTTQIGTNGSYSFISDNAQNSGNAVVTSTNSLGNTSESPNTAFTADLSSTSVLKALYLATGTMPELTFTPSLGINTEGPQGGASTAGMPMPFVDIFRTARPFQESQRIASTDINGVIIRDENNSIVYTQNSTTYDSNGWPTSIDPNKTYVSTTLLQGSLKDSIPNGKYTLLYDGSGTFAISQSGAISSTPTKIQNENKYEFNLTLNDFDHSQYFTEREEEQTVSATNQIYFGITGISESSYIKDIRIIMPGGTCTGNPYIRVDETDQCPSGTTYQSFESRLQANRNDIIFNPDYLLFLRNFKTIRMMNLMEASSKELCADPDLCDSSIGSWDERAKITDAVWGGKDGVTEPVDHKGVALEVVIELANTLNRDIWLNIPHFAHDDYILNAAEIINRDLNSSIKIYLEYSNEVWNSGFAGGAYMAKKGVALGLDTVPADKQTYCNGLTDEQKDANTTCHGEYYAQLRYFGQRSVEIFNLWKQKFTDSARLNRVLGSYVGSTTLTDLMLSHTPTGLTETIGDNVDSVAIAPYFYGCPYSNPQYNFCDGDQKVLVDAKTVDDVFEIIDQPALHPNDSTKYYDVKSLDGTILTVKKQLDVIKIHNQSGNDIKLITYEGGQHLVPSVLGKDVTTDKQTRLRKLFNEVNRDPRMKQRYITFLNGWKDLEPEGATLFTLYTMPQSYYRYGNFGIKEHVNKSREESPKFDGVMTFQESMGNCWWNEAGCTQ